MSELQGTRAVVLRADAHPETAENFGTRFAAIGSLAELLAVDHHALFNRHQRRLAELLGGYTRPGIALVALHRSNGIAGHLWLEATAVLRAAVIGRHSSVDFFLGDDEALSLRHLLVLVRQVAGVPRYRISDLATLTGFEDEDGRALRAVEAEGALVLRVAGSSLLVFPTGAPPPWTRDAADPWATLPRRPSYVDRRELDVRPAPRAATPQDVTAVADIGALEELGREPALHAGEAVEGHLVLVRDGVAEHLPVGATALGRGVIVGRYARCSGEVPVEHDRVSRVHAVVAVVDGRIHIIDAGSTNGIALGERAVRCAPLEAGMPYRLGGLTLRWEPAQAATGDSTPLC